jgi:hypothetical protein
MGGLIDADEHPSRLVEPGQLVLALWLASVGLCDLLPCPPTVLEVDQRLQAKAHRF